MRATAPALTRPGDIATPDAFCLEHPSSPADAGDSPSEEPEESDESDESEDWSVVASPNASKAVTSNVFIDVTCTSPSDCWAVGAHLAGNRYRTLVARWDGTSWSETPSPNISGAVLNVLWGVSCSAASDCWAVGHSATGLSAATYRTLVLRWDGTSWAIVASPNASPDSTNVLYAVTCLSASDCWAVGYHQVGSWTQTQIQRWDGTTWRVVASPNSEQHNSLSGVACVSASDCWAVGSFGAGIEGSSLVQRWDGDSWRIVASPRVDGARNQSLKSVTCPSASECWAVGITVHSSESWHTLIQRWDGRAWQVVPTPNGSADLRNVLEGVACTSPSDCWAVSSYQVAGDIGPPDVRTLVVRWDGTSWTIVASPNPGPHSNFRSVACVSASDCWAVGGYGLTAQTLAARWEGSAWTAVSSPNVGLPRNNTVASVTCLSDTDCWAVGHYDGEGRDETLILRWQGRWWTLTDSPNVGGADANHLSSVTCVSMSDCWAVGHHEANGVARTLLLRWDGISWRIIQPPDTLAARSTLAAVTCVAADDCWAVGHADTASRQALMLRWDGDAWQTAEPPESGQATTVAAVTCASSDDCWAVGHRSDGGEQPLILRWDGDSWQAVGSPESGQDSTLTGVTCTSVDDCWAVGHADAGSSRQILMLRWDGDSWQTTDPPDSLTAQDATLTGVTCTASDACWAVGHAHAGSRQTLILGWDGDSWQTTDPPDSLTGRDPTLTGVTCASADACWAVGRQQRDGVTQTLVMRRALETPPRLAYLGPAAALRTAPVTLSARLTDQAGAPAQDRILYFQIDEFEEQAVTDADGIARVQIELNQSYGTYELVVRFTGDEDGPVEPAEVALPLTVLWEYAFTDDDKLLRIDTRTRQLQFAASGDVSEVKTDPDMKVETLPTGETVIEIDYSDEELSVTGRFRPEDQRFVALVRTPARPYVLTAMP